MKKVISALMTAVLAVLLILVVHAEEVPVINEMPVSVSASVGDFVQLSCSAEEPTDGATLKYVWYRAQHPDDEGEAVTEAQSIGTYQPNTDFPGEVYYYCVAYYIYEETSTYAKSDVITVMVEGKVNIKTPVIVTDVETSYSVPQGGELIINIECEPQSEPIVISYQWYSKHPSEKVFNRVPGGDESTLKVSSDSVGTMQYFCMVTASYGDRSSNAQSAITRIEVYSHEHTFGGWTVTVSPSCNAEGEEIRTCECGATEKKVLDALEHSYGEWIVTREPTAYAAGERTRTCSECKNSEISTIKPLETVTDDETTAPPKESEGETEFSDTAITTAAPEAEKYQPRKVFPWWNAILIFGVVSTIGAAAAAFYFIRRSNTIINNERQKILGLRTKANTKQPPNNSEK